MQLGPQGQGTRKSESICSTGEPVSTRAVPRRGQSFVRGNDAGHQPSNSGDRGPESPQAVVLARPVQAQHSMHLYPWTSLPGRRGPIHRHVLAAEKALGHRPPKGAEIHHIDENKDNFRNDNLVILENRGEHTALHRRLRVLRAGGDPWTQYLCGHCGVPKDFEEFYPCKALKNWCRECCRLVSRNYQRLKRSVLRGKTV